MSDSFEIQAEQLDSPTLWFRWRAAERARGLTPQESAAKLADWDTDLALLRRAMLLEGAEQLDDALPCLRACLTSPLPVIRAYAMAVLVHSEATGRLQAAPEELEQINPAVDILEKCVITLRASGERSDLALEAEVLILYNLCSLLSLVRRYSQAMQYASEAIYLSLPLAAPGLTSAVRMSYALAATHLGQTQEALREYAAVGASTSNPHQRHYAALNCSLLHLMHGETGTAQQLLDTLDEAHQDKTPTRVTRQYLAAMTGRLGPGEAIEECPQGVYDILNPCLRLLLYPAPGGKKAALSEALDRMRRWRPKSQLDEPIAQWLQTTALLGLDRPYLAAQRIHGVIPLYPLSEALILGVKIDICLHHDGVDVEPLEELCKRLQALFRRLPSAEARDGLAALMGMWHPQAAALVAMSPFSVCELVDVALPAVFMDGRPIHVHGTAVPTRLPFLQLSLEAFGVDAIVARDQSVERERLARALKVTWGSAQRTLPVVPPSLLIFQYLRLAERNPREAPLWRRAAQELVLSHGTLPTTSGGHLRAQRAALEDALQRLLSQDISVQKFQSIARSLNKSRTVA